MPLGIPISVTVNFRAPQLEALMSQLSDRLDALTGAVNEVKTQLGEAQGRILADFEALKNQIGNVAAEDVARLEASIAALGEVALGLSQIDPDPTHPPSE